MSTLKKFIKKNKYVTVPLKLTATNHLEVKAKINGIKGVFILDTGASNTCIGFDKLEHFNLTSKVSDIKAAGAGATDMETHISSKNKIEIGKWKQKKLKIVLFDLTNVNQALEAHNVPKVDGIIGADVLNQTKAIIDYNAKRVYLSSKK
ncbi:TIGR02281 family clan AA aspartic protease [Maribacter chungangensis]|uniref:TIGR02281 family clan AA aspartic protease n=1 Tax=Maribacter chungangensis TaxID=1069117 RepID=A0ABW3AZR6_9FLAO